MELTQYQKDFISVLKESIEQDTFIKISLGNYKGNERELKQLLVRRVKIKKEEKLAFTYRYKTRDIVKNLGIDDGLASLAAFLDNGFKIATLFTVREEFILEELKSGKQVLRRNETAQNNQTDTNHDRQKNKLISSQNKPYLTALKITDDNGEVYKSAQDKFKQINHYIAILSSLIKELPEGTIKKVVDMGAGKGYLTFALYDYLHSTLQLDTEVTGVEYRPDLVQLCNNVANEAGFKSLSFEEGTIEAYDAEKVNLLIALHACDTATDDAIFKGIKAGAELIVVAPCCHKQIRRQIEAGKAKNDVSFLTKYGIFLERQAEMVTDGIRTLILEYFGYKTKVMEFISDAHTPKNVLVVGIKSKEQGAKGREDILQKIKDAKAYFGIGYHHLEKLLEI